MRLGLREGRVSFESRYGKVKSEVKVGSDQVRVSLPFSFQGGMRLLFSVAAHDEDAAAGGDAADSPSTNESDVKSVSLPVAVDGAAVPTN